MFLSIFIFILCLFFGLLILKPSRKVYLVDFACFKPKKSQQRTREDAVRFFQKYYSPNLEEKTLKVLFSSTIGSGLGDGTYFPEPLLRNPLDFSLEGARSEAETAIYSVVDTVLAKTGVKVEDIGLLVVNCTVFNPVPSLSDMIVNRYKLREDVKSFDVTGMGCSASLVAMELAYRLLEVHKNSYVLVVSTEILGQNLYYGNDANKLKLNCVMRVGGAAILLSNRMSVSHTSKYRLIHAVHTNTASSDRAYKCIFREEDSQGMIGIDITKDLLLEARKVLDVHLNALCPLILPISEKLRLCLKYLMRKLHAANIEKRTPNFKRATDHFLPHVGAAMVIDVLERTLKLDVEASRMTLYRFGNTSSSSVWYELAYVEAKGKVKKGDRLWQIAYGSGFKCNSIIWRAVRSVGRADALGNPWSDEIDDYPVDMASALPKETIEALFEQPK